MPLSEKAATGCLGAKRTEPRHDAVKATGPHGTWGAERTESRQSTEYQNSKDCYPEDWCSVMDRFVRGVGVPHGYRMEKTRGAMRHEGKYDVEIIKGNNQKRVYPVTFFSKTGTL